MKTKICIKCGKEFPLYPLINGKRCGFKGRRKCTECSPYNAERSKLVNVPCANCGKIVHRRIFSSSGFDIFGKNFFCDNSCAATFNNKIVPKRGLTKKCKTCNNKITAQRTYCTNCFDKIKQQYEEITKDLESSPLANFMRLNTALRFNKIRIAAKKKTKNLEQKCKICGYSKHVEVAHIKEIHSFPPETLVKEINDISNLVLLCCNCHWELDNDLLSEENKKMVGPVGLEPTTRTL